MHKWRIVMLIVWSTMMGFAQNKSFSQTDTSVKNIFIIHKNSQYGLGDNAEWYANTPVGDTLFHLGDAFFAVRQNGNYTIVDEAFKITANKIKKIQTFGYYYFLKDSLGWKAFYKDGNMAAHYFDSIKISGDHAWLFKDGKQGIVAHNWPLKDLILPMYDKVGPYYDGMLLINKGKLGWVGEISIDVGYDHIYKEREDVIAAQNSSGTIYYYLESKKKLLIEPGDSVVFYDTFYKRVRGKQQSIFYLSDNKLYGEINNYEIHPFSFNNYSGTQSYCIVSKDTTCALFKNGSLLTGFEYSNFLVQSDIQAPFFRVVKDHKVGVINDKNEIQLKALYNDVVDKSDDAYIVRLENKLGIRTKGDSAILPEIYRSITFCDNKYAYVSLDGKLFGLFNYKNKSEVLPCKYNSFYIDSVFVLARLGEVYDVYYKGILKFSGVYDARSNGTTVKSYKEGKIYMGYVRNYAWEEYSYEIPSYKVASAEINENALRPYIFSDFEDRYDYATGKWGQYSYSVQGWHNKPLAHSGDRPNGERLLGFSNDSLITWQGINFQTKKALSPIDLAWEKKSRFYWMDVNSYGYNKSNDNTMINISPICYTAPGNGECLQGYKKATVNNVFRGSYNRSVIVENGKVEVANSGDISLANYISQITTNGSIHAKAISDYEKIIDPANFIRISGATEHILQRTFNKGLSISSAIAFEWLDKKEMEPFILKYGNNYGVLTDSASYMLKPEYESVDVIKIGQAKFLKLGVRSTSFKLYDPVNKTFSLPIRNLIGAEGELMLLKTNEHEYAILNKRLDTLMKSNKPAFLLGGNDFYISDSTGKLVYRERKVLFSCQASVIEKINNEHFMLRSLVKNVIINLKGDTLFSSGKPIKYLALGSNYLLDDGAAHTLFDNNDKVIFKFEKAGYLTNDNKDLIIKEEKSTLVFQKNQQTKIVLKGKFIKENNAYVIIAKDKYKSVFSFNGKEILAKAKQVKAVNDNYIAFSDGKKYFLLDISSGEKIKIKNLNVDLTKEGIDYETMDESIQTVVLKYNDSLRISEYNGRYGLKKGSKTVLPRAYFSITKFADMYLVQNSLDYMIFDPRSRKFISDTAYEQIYTYRNYFAVIKNGRLDYLNPFKKEASFGKN